MAATLLGDEQAGDLALHPRCNHDRARLGQRLRTRRDVRHVAENLAAGPPVSVPFRAISWSFLFI